MFVEKFYNQVENQVVFTRKQASEFAKQIADDFNPLHDEDAKRFCVPGDLLFSVILSKAGLSKKMTFTFSGMVSDGIALNFPTQLDNKNIITDNNDKEYLTVTSSDEQTNNDALIESLIKAYVGFSGHTFPHILCDLMAKNKVMINPARPMVMYESMSIEMFDLNVTNVTLKSSASILNIDGKRGNACLAFNLLSDGEIVGRGEKHMVLSGLRPYCNDTITEISDRYLASKASYNQAA